MYPGVYITLPRGRGGALTYKMSPFSYNFLTNMEKKEGEEWARVTR